jgi:hypothetical protein
MFIFLLLGGAAIAHATAARAVEKAVLVPKDARAAESETVPVQHAVSQTLTNQAPPEAKISRVI